MSATSSISSPDKDNTSAARITLLPAHEEVSPSLATVPIEGEATPRDDVASRVTDEGSLHAEPGPPDSEDDKSGDSSEWTTDDDQPSNPFQSSSTSQARSQSQAPNMEAVQWQGRGTDDGLTRLEQIQQDSPDTYPMPDHAPLTATQTTLAAAVLSARFATDLALLQNRMRSLPGLTWPTELEASSIRSEASSIQSGDPPTQSEPSPINSCELGYDPPDVSASPKTASSASLVLDSTLASEHATPASTSQGDTAPSQAQNIEAVESQGD